jgi:hypothetical protein
MPRTGSRSTSRSESPAGARVRARIPAVLAAALTAFLALPGPAAAQVLDDLADRLVAAAPVPTTVAGKTATHGALSSVVSDGFTGVVVEARVSSGALTAEVRFMGVGDPGPWLPMRIVRSATSDALIAGYRSDLVRSGVRIEVRIATPDDADVSIGQVGTFDNRLDQDRRPAPDGLAPLPAAATGTIVPPPLITREEWGAEPFIGTPSPLANPSYDYMTFHHAAGYSATTLAEGIAQVKAIQDLHQEVRGWSDIGYQFLIDRGGRLYQGRPFMTDAGSLEELPVLALGAHVGGANTGNIGVSLLGCYHPPEGSYCEQVITPEAWDTYVTLFAFLAERYGVPTDRIRGHRDFSATACPGDNNYVLLTELRTEMLELLESGGGSLEDPDDFVLSSTFPNPADDEIRVRYALREPGFVSLDLFDATGRRIRALAAGYHETDTWFTVSIDTAHLPAGMYFYRIRVEGFAGVAYDRTRSVAVVH